MDEDPTLSGVFLVDWDLISKTCCGYCATNLWKKLAGTDSASEDQKTGKLLNENNSCLDMRFPPESFVELVVSDSKDFLSGKFNNFHL